MDEKRILEKGKELIKKLTEASEAYYERNESPISDDEWDELYAQLRELEETYHIHFPDSPTHRIGGKIMESFEPHRHIAKLWSMDKAQTEAEIKLWAQRCEKLAVDAELLPPKCFCVEYKLDGLTINLTYDQGKLVQAATRGNGEIGESILEQVKTIRTIPITIPYQGKMEVQGEGIMRLSVLDRYNQTANEPLKNARNAAAGALRNIDPSVTASRNLDAFFYQIGYIEGKSFKTQLEMLSFLKENGFEVSPYIQFTQSIEDALNTVRQIERMRESLDYLIDGATIKITDMRTREILGYTDKFPRWAIAYKFAAQEKITKLLHISWELGRTGKLTPIAHLEPIDICGVTVKRATLNNYGDICRKHIRLESDVWVRRSNDVIPEIMGIVWNRSDPIPETDIAEPIRCPGCGGELVAKGAHLYCMNKVSCRPQAIARMTHYASRQGMDIEAFSEKTAELFYDKIGVRSAADLYTLHRDDLVHLRGFGEKKVDKLFAELEKSKVCDLAAFLYAIGIPNIGKKTARDLITHFGSLEELEHATEEELTQIEDVGAVVASSITEFFKQKENRTLVNRLLAYGVKPTIKKHEGVQGTAFEGITFVLTGTLPTLTRVQAEELIRKNGGRISSSVSKKTGIVLAGENAGSKLDKAINLGISIIDEKTFMDQIAAKSSDE